MDFKTRFRYSTDQPLGIGGFARVYKAWDTLLERDVAIKIFPSSTQQGKGNIVDEIRKAVRLQHPNLLTYYDVVLIENVNPLGEKEFIQVGIMEYANKGDLKSFVAANRDPRLIHSVLVDILRGLSYLHKKGIIHRDLKPQNILLTDSDGYITAKIADFGISKDVLANHTQSSALLGTIEYMAPEQFNPVAYGIDGKIGTSVDLWAFGVLAYEIITGNKLFGDRTSGISQEQIMTAILSKQMPVGVYHLIEPYQTLIKSCLITDAKKRVNQADYLLSLLEGKYGTPRVAVASETVKPVALVEPVVPQVTGNPIVQPQPPATEQPVVTEVLKKPETVQQPIPQEQSKTEILNKTVNTPSTVTETPKQPVQHFDQKTQVIPREQAQSFKQVQPNINYHPPKPPAGNTATQRGQKKSAWTMERVLLGVAGLLIIIILFAFIFRSKKSDHVFSPNVAAALKKFPEDSVAAIADLEHLRLRGNETAYAELADRYVNVKDSTALEYITWLAENGSPDYQSRALEILAETYMNNASIFADRNLALATALKGATANPKCYEIAQTILYQDSSLLLDIDLKRYHCVSIDGQRWMARNLDVNHFRNGQEIEQVFSSQQWIDAYKNSTPVWCWYNWDPEMGRQYGKIYNYYAVNSGNGLAPEGWHIPNWDELHSIKLKGIDKTCEIWPQYSPSNSIGFSALPGGAINSEGIPESEGYRAWWWTSSGKCCVDGQDYYYNDPTCETAGGYYVRCVKNQ